MRRYAGSLTIALAIVLGLFLLMMWMIAPPEDPTESVRDIVGVDIVDAQEEAAPEAEALQPLQAPPPPPPSAPTALSTDLPQVTLPVLNVVATAGPIKLPASGLSGGGLTLSGSGVFGGFAGGGGSGGFGKGEGFRGKDLVPLSTARPQIPDFACKQGIEGWTEVVFTVMPNGRVQDVKIIDSKPRGVFEAAAVESISNWIYEEHSRARMVKQRNEYKLADCQYNWR